MLPQLTLDAHAAEEGLRVGEAPGVRVRVRSRFRVRVRVRATRRKSVFELAKHQWLSARLVMPAARWSSLAGRVTSSPKAAWSQGRIRVRVRVRARARARVRHRHRIGASRGTPGP